MKEKIEILSKEIDEGLSKVSNLNELNELKIKYLSKNGPVSELTSGLKDLSVDEKKEYGKLITDFKNDIFTKFEDLKSKYELEELNKK